MANQELLLRDDSYVPPELLLDKTIPANDVYLTKLAYIQKACVQAQQAMSPSQVAVVKAKHRGASHTEAAEEAGYKSAQGVSQALLNPKCKKLLSLLRHYTSAVDGPNTQQRMNMLYRIATANEFSEPRVAIQAIETMNKMEGTYQDTGISGGINITINQQSLPRTALDG